MYDFYGFLYFCLFIFILWSIFDLGISLFAICLNLFLTALWFVPFVIWCIASGIYKAWKEDVRIMGLCKPHDDNMYVPDGTYKINKKN